MCFSIHFIGTERRPPVQVSRYIVFSAEKLCQSRIGGFVQSACLFVKVKQAVKMYNRIRDRRAENAQTGCSIGIEHHVLVDIPVLLIDRLKLTVQMYFFCVFFTDTVRKPIITQNVPGREKRKNSSPGGNGAVEVPCVR